MDFMEKNPFTEMDQKLLSAIKFKKEKYLIERGFEQGEKDHYDHLYDFAFVVAYNALNSPIKDANERHATILIGMKATTKSILDGFMNISMAMWISGMIYKHNFEQVPGYTLYRIA